MDNTQNNTARKQLAHPKLAMVAMLLGAFVGMLSETSLNIALPILMLSLRVNMATIQWLVTGYMLVMGMILPLSSLISQWFTTRQIIIFGLLSFIIGAVISACASSFPGVLIGRMVQGIGTGFIHSTNVCRRNANLSTPKAWGCIGNLCTSNYVCTSDWANTYRTNSC